MCPIQDLWSSPLMMQRVCEAELQKRADNAGQLVLFFWLVLIFGKGARKAVPLCLFWAIFDLFGANFVGKVGGANFHAFCNYTVERALVL